MAVKILSGLSSLFYLLPGITSQIQYTADHGSITTWPSNIPQNVTSMLIQRNNQFTSIPEEALVPFEDLTDVVIRLNPLQETTN